MLSVLKNAADQRELAVLVNYLLVDTSVFRGFPLQHKDHLVFSECHVVKPLSSHLPCAGFGYRDCQDGCWAVFVYLGHKVTFFNAYKGIH